MKWLVYGLAIQPLTETNAADFLTATLFKRAVVLQLFSSDAGC